MRRGLYQRYKIVEWTHPVFVDTPIFFYIPMHEVTPKVVAMAVSTVMRICITLLQMFLFSLLMVGIVLVCAF